jgi:hypothetical protein
MYFIKIKTSKNIYIIEEKNSKALLNEFINFVELKKITKDSTVISSNFYKVKRNYNEILSSYLI